MKLGTPHIKDSDRERANLLEDLVAAVNAHDRYTGSHSYRTAAYASAVAHALGYPPPAVELVRQAALVHDIGKIGIPERILRKTQELTDEDRSLLRLHPDLGVSILSRLPGTAALLPIVLHHHEHWDGSGYPLGLRGTEIPIESRIILVADSFDAITTQRPYSRMLEPAGAMEEIALCSGTQFDPLVVDALHETHEAAALDGLGPRTIRITDSEDRLP
ncbi:MAG: HD domain-containing protein [Actinobacteria bacterium]|nr:HD domain-containing protein [Actinomycetota bacterium]